MNLLMNALLMILALSVALVHSADAQEPPPDASDVRRVRVTAEGINRDDAVKQALRRAIEQGAGVVLSSHSQTANFELIRDTIYSKAAGIVKDYRVLEESKGAGGTVIVTIEAAVRPDAVAREWGEVQNVLDQIGRPRIMVWIDETIDNAPQSDSIVQTRLQEMFVKAGFDLVERGAIAELLAREKADAANEKNAAKLARLAKDAGAQILVRGSANANRAGIERLYDVPVAFYSCDVQARVYYTDTGRLLASESLPSTRAGDRSRNEFSPQAARAAMVRATFPDAGNEPRRGDSLSGRLYETIMQQWATQISAGGELILEVENLDFKAYLKIKNALAQMENVLSVDGDFSKGAGTFRIHARVSGPNFAEQIAGRLGDVLEVVDLKANRIRAKGVAKP